MTDSGRRDELSAPSAHDSGPDVPGPGRRRTVRSVLTVVAALALLGGGYASGAALGPGRDRQPEVAPQVSTPPAVAEPVTPEAVPVPAITARPSLAADLAEDAAGAGVGDDEGAGDDGDAFDGGWSTHTLFALGDLTPAPDSAPRSATGWGYDAQSVFTADVAARWAAAVGLAGTPTRNEWSWMVGPADWSTATLTLSLDALANVSYFDPAAEVPWCGDVGTVDANPDPRCLRVQDPPPPADAAIASLRSALVAAGVDVDGLDFTLADWSGGSYTAVTATPRGTDAAEYRPGTWQGYYSARGLYSLSGSVALPVDLGEYDIVTPAEGVDRLSDPRFAPTSISSAPDSFYSEPYVAPTAPPAPPVAGGQMPWDVATATITGWRLTRALYYTEDGPVLEMPTYRFSDTGGFTWDVLAVAGHHLAF